MILFSNRVIEPGEEICFAYKTFSNPEEYLSPEVARTKLQNSWSIVCPPNCFCYKKGISELGMKSQELDRYLKENTMYPVQAVAASEQLLSLLDDLNSSYLVRESILYNGFLVGM
ncbi:hypothetical protein BVRB_032530, partial [Beta vulgaris subsp. vulgaris]